MLRRMEDKGSGIGNVCPFWTLRKGFAREEGVTKREVGNYMEKVIYPQYGDTPNKKD